MKKKKVQLPEWADEEAMALDLNAGKVKKTHQETAADRQSLPFSLDFDFQEAANALSSVDQETFEQARTIPECESCLDHLLAINEIIVTSFFGRLPSHEKREPVVKNGKMYILKTERDFRVGDYKERNIAPFKGVDGRWYLYVRVSKNNLINFVNSVASMIRVKSPMQYSANNSLWEFKFNFNKNRDVRLRELTVSQCRKLIMHAFFHGYNKIADILNSIDYSPDHFKNYTILENLLVLDNYVEPGAKSMFCFYDEKIEKKIAIERFCVNSIMLCILSKEIKEGNLKAKEVYPQYWEYLSFNNRSSKNNDVPIVPSKSTKGKRQNIVRRSLNDHATLADKDKMREMMREKKGSRFLGDYVCPLCNKSHTLGYHYRNDLIEFDVCRDCMLKYYNQDRHMSVRIIYTPMSNGKKR